AVTVYQIRERHRNEEVREVVPAEYEGVLVTDRGRSYDAQELAGVRQQKCLAHIQRSLSDVLAHQQGKARAFGSRLKGLFRQALDLWHDYHQGQRSGFAAQAQYLQDALTHHLRERPLKDPDNQRLLTELGGITIGAICCAFWTTHASSPPTTGQRGRCGRRSSPARCRSAPRTRGGRKRLQRSPV
ncbi:MAG: transposase, partial [Deltaproteobacteria bacterium]|nr:transposase [Deltaproteobacteria bacterium]